MARLTKTLIAIRSNRLCKTATNPINKILRIETAHRPQPSSYAARLSDQDSLRNLQRQLTKANEVVKVAFRAPGAVPAISTLAVTISFSSKGFNRFRTTKRNDHGRDQAGRMSTTNDSVDNPNINLNAQRRRVIDYDITSRQALASIDTEEDFNAAHGCQLSAFMRHLQRFQRLQRSPPPQVLLQQPVTFVDTSQRIAPLHLEWFGSWKSFMTYLERRFSYRAQDMIRPKRFIVEEAIRGRAITTAKPLAMSVGPRQRVMIGMILAANTNASPGNVCPFCHTACDSPAKDDVECLRCGHHYRRLQPHSDIWVTLRDVTEDTDLTADDAASLVDFGRVALFEDHHDFEFDGDILPPPYALEDVALHNV